MSLWLQPEVHFYQNMWYSPSESAKRWLPNVVTAFSKIKIIPSFYQLSNWQIKLVDGTLCKRNWTDRQCRSLYTIGLMSFWCSKFRMNSQKTSFRFSKFRRPARRTHVILMFKVSHELSENVISIFQVSQTHIHTHTLTYTHILTYPNPGWPQMAQMASDRPRWLQTALEGPRWL